MVVYRRVSDRTLNIPLQLLKCRYSALGLLGKLLTGPWMQVFYISAESELDHIKGISVIKNVMTTLKVAVRDPCNIITRDRFFWKVVK